MLPVGQASACPAPSPPGLPSYKRLGDDRAGQAEACPTGSIFAIPKRLLVLDGHSKSRLISDS